MKKKIITMLIFAIMMYTFSCVCASDIVEIIGGGEEIAPLPVDKSFASKILGAFQWAGYAVAIGMLIYLGIKYVMASAEEKSELKGSMVKYLVGAALIVGASSIANWLFNFKTN